VTIRRGAKIRAMAGLSSIFGFARSLLAQTLGPAAFPADEPCARHEGFPTGMKPFLTHWSQGRDKEQK